MQVDISSKSQFYVLSALKPPSYLQFSLSTVCVSAYILHNSLYSSVREVQLANLAQVLIDITFEAYFHISKVSKFQSDNTEHASQVEIDKINKHLSYSQFTEVLIYYSNNSLDGELENFKMTRFH